MQTGAAKKTIQRLWSDPDTLATPLVLWVADRLGMEALNWHPETLWHEITDEIGVIPPPSIFDRFLAGVSILTTNRFWTSLPDFINICNVLSGSTFDPEEFDPADAAECAWGMTEALLLEQPERDNLADLFDPDILAYIGHVCREEGLLHPPSVLKLGGVTPEETANTLYDFADDPELFESVYATSQEKSKEINDLLRERLTRLVHQIEALPLEHGAVDNAASRLRKLLPT